MRQGTKIWTTAAVAVGWAAAVAVGLRGLLDYESTPGTVAAVPSAWPASQIPLAPDRATLVMLAHPHCPCTRASVGELSEIMAQANGKAVAYVLFARPAGSGADWEESDLRRSTGTIPGVTVLSDADGVEGRRFGAETSGHTLVFAVDGRLLFSGGITQSRGHAGDNAGKSAIAALLRGERAERAQTFVFGCSLPKRSKTAPGALALK